MAIVLQELWGFEQIPHGCILYLNRLPQGMTYQNNSYVWIELQLYYITTSGCCKRIPLDNKSPLLRFIGESCIDLGYSPGQLNLSSMQVGQLITLHSQHFPPPHARSEAAYDDIVTIYEQQHANFTPENRLNATEIRSIYRWLVQMVDPNMSSRLSITEALDSYEAIMAPRAVLASRHAILHRVPTPFNAFFAPPPASSSEAPALDSVVYSP